MNNFFELDKLLAAYDSDDLWSEYGVDRAEEILCRFEESDWEYLEKELDDRSDDWVARAADTLGAGRADRALVILMHLLENSNNRDVLFQAAGSINRLRAKYPEREYIKFSEATARKLVQLMESEGPVSRLVVGELLQTNSQAS